MTRQQSTHPSASDLALYARVGRTLVLSIVAPGGYPSEQIEEAAHAALGGPPATAQQWAGRDRDYGRRITLVGPDTASIRAGLAARLASPPPAETVEAPLVMMFSGQGSQVVGMGEAACGAFRSFRRAFDECCELFEPLIGADLREVLWGSEASESRLRHTTMAQPAIFALGYALNALWRDIGVRPAMYMGHSIGELTAANAAGAFDVETGVCLVAARSRWMGAATEGGAMAAIRAPQADVEKAIATATGVLSLAAINGATNVVVSGDAPAVEELCRGFEAEGVACQPLSVSHAFHSAHMDPVLEDLAREIGELPSRPPRASLLSNVTGGFHSTETPIPTRYWLNHIREPVRFADNLSSAVAAGGAAFMELGAQGVLAGMAIRQLGRKGPPVVATLGPDADPIEYLCATAARLTDLGQPVRWDELLSQVGVLASTPNPRVIA